MKNITGQQAIGVIILIIIAILIWRKLRKPPAPAFKPAAAIAACKAKGVCFKWDDATASCVASGLQGCNPTSNSENLAN